MITRTDVAPLLLRAEYSSAARSVSCPRCSAHPGEDCKSTGGGNPMAVPTHKARWDRIAHWSEEQLAAAQALVRKQGRTWWPRLPDGFYAVQEAAAAPVVAKVKATTPKGVRLSEAQAEEIERAAANGGTCWVSTAHFHGDAQHRQSTNALEAKDILRDTGETTDGDWERRLELTEFGWRVYHEHRLIIRRVPNVDHAQICPCRVAVREACIAQVEQAVAAGSVGAGGDLAARRAQARPRLRVVAAGARGTTGAKVLDLTAKLAGRNGSTPSDVA